MYVTLHSLLANHRTEEGRASDSLCLFQAFVECRAEGSVTATDFTCDGQDGVERPRRPFHQTFIGIIGWIEERDKVMASCEKATGTVNND